MKKYLVKKVSSPLHIDVEVPGSKSITNRALLMAAMGKGESELRGVLFSDDSDCFLNSLQELGFSIQTDKRRRCVRILGQGGTVPKKKQVFM